MRRTLAKFVITALLAISTTACSGYMAPDTAFHKALQSPYTLDAGDVVNVTVFEQAELSRSYSVDRSGYLAFPLVGSVAARGKTVKQLEANLAAQLKQGFLRDPDVSVEVAQYRPFYVMGEVGRPGQYAYVPGMTVQSAVASSGGFSSRAQQINADITRQVNGKVFTGRVAITDPIMPGDTIYVRERMF